MGKPLSVFLKMASGKCNSKQKNDAVDRNAFTVVPPFSAARYLKLEFFLILALWHFLHFAVSVNKAAIFCRKLAARAKQMTTYWSYNCF